MSKKQTVQITVVLVCLVIVAAIVYVGGASMTNMIRLHMGGQEVVLNGKCSLEIH